MRGNGWWRALTRAVALALASCAAGAGAAEVSVSVSSPTPGGKLRDYLHQARVEGNALAAGGGPTSSM